MERTFSETVITEGKKQGYLEATQVIEQLARHDLLEPEVIIEMPEISNDFLKPENQS